MSKTYWPKQIGTLLISKCPSHSRTCSWPSITDVLTIHGKMWLKQIILQPTHWNIHKILASNQNSVCYNFTSSNSLRTNHIWIRGKIDLVVQSIWHSNQTGSTSKIDLENKSIDLKNERALGQKIILNMKDCLTKWR